MKTKERILYWDVIKALTIFLVIYAHGLQFFTNDNNYWQKDFTCQFIISFHMPLFMIISGYFANSIFNQNFQTILYKKSRQLLLPSISTYFLVGIVLMALRNQNFFTHIDNLLFFCTQSFWFLKALFVYYIIASLYRIIFLKSRIFFYITILVTFLCIRILPPQYVDFVHITTMFPYFIIGLLFYNYQNKIFKNHKLIMTLSLMIFIILSHFWQSNEYNIYTHPIEWNSQYLRLYLIRTIIGTTGSLSIILIIKKILYKQNSNWVTKIAQIGNATLGIYIFQYFIIARFINLKCLPYIAYLNILKGTNFESFFYDFILTPIISLIILIVCWLLVLITRKNNITKLFFLGEK